MRLKILQRITRFYSWVYLLLLIFTPLFVLGGSAIAFFSGTSVDPVEFKERFLIPGGRLLFGSVSFFIWWKIFHWLSVFFQPGVERTPQDKLSKLFIFAFVVEVFESALFAAYTREGPNWNEISFPTFSEHWALNVWMTIQWLLKVSATAGFFITPRTTGLSSLLMAGIFYVLSRHLKNAEQARRGV